MATKDPVRLLTVSEIAEHMRVSNMTVYRLIKRGELTAIRVGRSYRIRSEDLVAYLEGSANRRDVSSK